MAETTVIRIDAERPQRDVIERAAGIIRGGGLVAFPTETVYGLGADAMSEQAVRKIFEAKGRPADNPLIVHVDSRRMVGMVSAELTEEAERLMAAFWPGPLTLVVRRKPEVARSVSAGLETVALRMPQCKVALDLIRAAQTPIAAPSANLSGRPSPTSAEHVLQDLGGRVEMILDGGATKIGVESTVLDMTTDVPTILRPGWVTPEMIGETIGPVERAATTEQLHRSPGTRHRHYSPRARVILVEDGSRHLIAQILREHLEVGAAGFIGHTAVDIHDPKFHRIVLERGPDDYARSIYGALREMDEKRANVVVVEGITDTGAGAAVMDRLRRAASEIVSGRGRARHSG